MPLRPSGATCSSVLLKDTSAHGLGGVGDRTANLAINRRPTSDHTYKRAQKHTQKCYLGEVFRDQDEAVVVDEVTLDILTVKKTQG